MTTPHNDEAMGALMALKNELKEHDAIMKAQITSMAQSKEGTKTPGKIPNCDNMRQPNIFKGSIYRP